MSRLEQRALEPRSTRRRARSRGGVGAAAVLSWLLTLASPAWAWVDGDVTGDGVIDAIDVQCHAMVVRWADAGRAGPAPGCLGGAPSFADVNCDGSLTSDGTALLASKVLERALGPVDANQNGCADACEPACGSEDDGTCPAGVSLAFVDPVPLFARFGTAFAGTLHDKAAGTHDPVKVRVRATADGNPVAGCTLRWRGVDGLSWVFPGAAQTDAAGEVWAWWVAGDATTPKLRMESANGVSIETSGSAQPSPSTRANSIHFQFEIADIYDEVRVSVRPTTGPASTYYSTINFPGGYTGVQFQRYDTPDTTLVIFSVWDVEGVADGKAEIIDPGAANKTVGFGGEGTGVSARLVLPPSVHGAIPGLPDDYTLQVDHIYETHLQVSYPAGCSTCTDYTLQFTDKTRGLGPISLGTQRYKRREQPSWASAFVEDWNEVMGDNCLSAGQRSAYFQDIQHRRNGGAWVTSRRARFSPNYLPTNNEICINYHALVDSGRFFMSTGGATFVGSPLMGDGRWLELP